MGVAVHAANKSDGNGGLTLLDNMELFKERLEKFLRDTFYNGIFAQKVKGYLYEQVSRLVEDAKTGWSPREGKKFVI